MVHIEPDGPGEVGALFLRMCLMFLIEKLGKIGGVLGIGRCFMNLSKRTDFFFIFEKIVVHSLFSIDSILGGSITTSLLKKIQPILLCMFLRSNLKTLCLFLSILSISFSTLA